MAALPRDVRAKLVSILKDDYEDCSFFLAASRMLTGKIEDISAAVQNSETDFENLRDSIGEIGLLISNAEKRLEEVEECYTKLVDALAESLPPKT